MAIPPTLIFIFTLIPYLPISDRFIQELFSLIKDIVPGERNNSIIIGFLNDFLNQPRNELLSFGLLLAVVFSSNAMMGIMRSFDKKYVGFGRRRTLQKRKVALLLSLSFLLLVFSCLLLLIAQKAVLVWLGIENLWVHSAFENFRWVIIVLLVFFSVSIIYRFGPALTVKWPFITPGSVFATTLMILATLVVTVWVNNFNNYNKLYGSISAVFVLMSLIYVNALVILIGFELNVTLTMLKAKQAETVIT
jgi:membrane protein